MHRFAPLFFSTSLVLAACSSSSNKGTAGDGGATTGTSPDGGAGTTGATALSCLQVLQCIVACPDTDQACPDACAAKGTQDAQTKVVALATCLDTNKCQDSTCAQSKCGGELSACIDQSSQQSSTGSQPLNGQAPAGSVPAELVGYWFQGSVSYDSGSGSFSPGAGEAFELKADGTMSHALRVESTYACTTFFARASTGTATATATTLTLYETDNLIEKQTCNGPITTEHPPARQLDYAYRLANDQGQSVMYLTPSGGNESRYVKR